MKSRILFIATAFLMLASALIFSMADMGAEGIRYHQHLEQPSETALGICGKCRGGGTGLCTHLPIINIETGGQKIPGAAIVNELAEVTGYELGDKGEEEISVTLSTVDAEGVWHHTDDAPSVTAHALFRIRGNSSRAFDKPSYRIKFTDQENGEQNVKIALLGMEAESEWAMHGPFLDKTMLRNYMWMNISAEIMGYAPNVRFCELVLDGAYQGVYVLMETISVDEGRLNLTEHEAGSPVSSYLLRMDQDADPLKMIENFTFYTNRIAVGSSGSNKQIEILYPSLINQTEQVQNYICADFSEIERLLYSSKMLDGEGAWREVLDMDSFVDYFIIQEFLSVNDAFSASTYFYRDVRGKLHIGPMWDFNNALDNFFRPVSEEGFILSQKGWYSQLLKDEAFVDAVISRYRKLRDGILSDESLAGYAEETIAWLGSAVERNDEVWGYSYDIKNPYLPSEENELGLAEMRQPSLDKRKEIDALISINQEKGNEMLLKEMQAVNPSSYAQAVDWMNDYRIRRSAWLDAHIDSLKQYCASSKNEFLSIE